MKIEIKKNGEIFLDNNAIEFTADTLEEILDKGLINELEIVDDSTDEYKENPYIKLIKGIEEALKEDSEFIKQLNELKKFKEEEQKKLNNVFESEV